jgi:hypothetical protein
MAYELWLNFHNPSRILGLVIGKIVFCFLSILICSTQRSFQMGFGAKSSELRLEDSVLHHFGLMNTTWIVSAEVEGRAGGIKGK